MNKILCFLACTPLILGCSGKSKNDDDAGEDAIPDVADEDGTSGDVETEDTPPGDPAGDAGDVTTDGGEDAPTDPGDEEPVDDTLRFANIRCLPDVDGGEDVVAGQSMFCRFDVRGSVGRRVTLSCEDESGTDLNCTSSSPMQIQPFGSNPLPVFSGWFGIANSDSLEGTTVVVMWVADDTVEQARHRYEADVIADDGTNGAPSIEVTCEGDPDGNVDVTAGDRLDCRLVFLDPDPDTLTWDYTKTSGPDPVTGPSPYAGTGRAPFDVTWRWQTDSGESGTFVYQFSADDGTAAPVTFDLTVNVS